MAINPINVSRVSHNLRADFIADSVRRSQLEMFMSQTRIATGYRFVTPSEDPVGAARVLDLTQALARQDRFITNLTHGDNVLAAADDAINEVSGLLTEASMIASQNVSNLTSAAERLAVAEAVASITHQLQIVGNREFDGRYIFAGRETTDRPFVEALGGIAYRGDTGDLLTRIGEGLTGVINVPGNLLFGALSSRIASESDLTPALTGTTRLDAVHGASGRGVRPGTLVFNEPDGAGVFTVDLRSADTIGDIVTLINDAAAAAGSDLTASVSSTGLILTPGSAPVTVTDLSAGVIARDLGVLITEATTDPIIGGNLDPRLTRLTPVEALVGGTGIDLDSGFILTNGARSVTVDLSAAETVQDVINAINNTEAFVLARINEDGTGIDVFNQVSGTSLTIGENGGTTATDLGIRTFDTGTPLERLNFGLGVTIEEGRDDVRITAKNGSFVDVNLDGAVTVGDVIDLINDAAGQAGVNLVASFARTGNGICIADHTGGGGPLSVTGMNLSTAALDLGLARTVADPETELVGEDRNPTRTDGIISALLELEYALRDDDTQAIALAAQRLEGFADEVTRIHGIVGARSQAMQQKLEQMEDAASTTEIFLSEVRDLDYAEAVTRMQALTTQLQANLLTGSRLLSLSLMDYLG